MHILTLHCPDQPGIVASVAACLHNNGCNIEEAAQFHDDLSGHFFMRIVFSETKEDSLKNFKDCFDKTANTYSLTWDVHPQTAPVKTLIMVSNYDHCLHDLLYRTQTQRLNIEITGIVSNHETCRPLAKHHAIPFHHLPVTTDTKAQQETKLNNLIKKTGTDLIVMARYMQILTNEFCDAHNGQIINIHHSFLPGFKGARPYHQAYERGVKIIGATAHFATADLDEGPIIEQETLRITHADTPQKMESLGRDIETRVLARAINAYAQRRIFLHNGRTIIL